MIQTVEEVSKEASLKTGYLTRDLKDRQECPIQWHRIPFHYAKNSVGQDFKPGLVAMACFCSTVFRVSAKKTCMSGNNSNSWGWNHSQIPHAPQGVGHLQQGVEWSQSALPVLAATSPVLYCPGAVLG